MEIRRVRDEREMQAALELREAVFCREQGVTIEGDRDGLDPDALQLIAVTEEGEVVGTCRLLVGEGLGRFGRLAVAAHCRGQGLGARLLDEAVREARSLGADTIRLHAQTSALRLYERAGFVTCGEAFEEEGIEHVAMELPLA